MAVAIQLDGRVAIVTGAGAGIGLASAETLAAAGAAVVVSDRDPSAAQAVADAIRARGGEAIAQPCDVTDEAALAALTDAAIARFGRLDILVNNAGGGGPQPFDMPMGDFHWAYRTERFSRIFRLTQLAAPHMEQAGGGASAQHFLDGGRKQEYSHGLLRVVQGGGKPPHAQHRLRSRPEEHPR